MLPLLTLCCVWSLAANDGEADPGADRPDRKAPGIAALAAAPDGSGWLRGSQSGVAFRPFDGARERPIPTGLDHVHALAFSPDGSTLAVAGGSYGVLYAVAGVSALLGAAAVLPVKGVR